MAVTRNQKTIQLAPGDTVAGHIKGHAIFDGGAGGSFVLEDSTGGPIMTISLGANEHAVVPVNLPNGIGLDGASVGTVVVFEE